MFYQELSQTAIQESQLKEHFEQVYKKKKSLDPLLQELESLFLAPVEKKIGDLSAHDPALEQTFLLTKQQLVEMQLWLKIFYDAASSIIPSFSHISPLELRRQKAAARIEMLLSQLDPLEPAVRDIRRERLTHNVHTRISNALRAIEGPFRELLEAESDPEKRKKLTSFLEQQAWHLTTFANFFLSQFEEWEKMILKEMKGFLLKEPKHLPFPLMYTLFGRTYLILEVKGHFLGIGSSKIVCRGVDLQTAELVAAIRVHPKFPKAKDAQEEEKMKRYSFQDTWKESEILARLTGKPGILRLRDRLCFEIGGEKELYLVEDYFPDGSLKAYFRKKRTPLTPLQKGQIALQLLLGLKNIHDAHYVHADIKPENLLLNLRLELPQAVISDFSSAYLYTDPAEPLKLAHTSIWCPPEIAEILVHKGSPEERTRKPELLFKGDIWSMGCVLYRLFFDLELPWAKKKEEEVYEELVQLKAGWIPHVCRKHPFFPLIERMLEVAPANRLSAQEALQMFLKENPL